MGLCLWFMLRGEGPLALAKEKMVVLLRGLERPSRVYMVSTGVYGGPSWRYKCGVPSRAGLPQGLLTLLFIPTQPKPLPVSPVKTVQCAVRECALAGNL